VVFIHGVFGVSCCLFVKAYGLTTGDLQFALMAGYLECVMVWWWALPQYNTVGLYRLCTVCVVLILSAVLLAEGSGGSSVVTVTPDDCSGLSAGSGAHRVHSKHVRSAPSQGQTAACATSSL